MNTSAQPSRRKAQALIALTSIVGVTAVVSLALWTATTYLKGTITTGTVAGIEASVDGGVNFFQRTTAGTAEALVITPADTPISPGQSVATAVQLRTVSGTNVQVPVKLITSVALNGEGLLYKVLDASTETCSADSTGAVIIPETLLAGGTQPTEIITLAAGTSTTPGAATQLCIVMTANTDAAETVSAEALFEFTTAY